MPVKLYFPKTGNGPFPVIIFSHGLGGSRDGYEYLGRHWASHGYVSVHLQHKGSDTAVWKDQANPMEAMRQAVKDLRNSINRPLDVRFAIDQMEKMNRDKGPLHGRLDLGRVGMAGHSFGAWTTLAVIGEVFVGLGGREISLADPRVKAAIAMSARPPRQNQARPGVRPHQDSLPAHDRHAGRQPYRRHQGQGPPLAVRSHHCRRPVPGYLHRAATT